MPALNVIYKLVNPKNILIISIAIGFNLQLLGFEPNKEAYKDILRTIAPLFASMVAFIAMFLIFKMESLENRKLYAFQDLRNLVRGIRNIVITENAGGNYQVLVRFDSEPLSNNEDLLRNVDLLWKKYTTDDHFKREIDRNQNLAARLFVDLKVASDNVHRIDKLIKDVKSPVIKESFRDMFLLIIISIILLPLGNINISSLYFEWLVDNAWKPWLKFPFLMVIIGFSIITLIKVYDAIKSLLKSD